MTDQQFSALFGVLSQIRDLLAGAADQTEDEAFTECPHPDDQRVALGFTNGSPHWVCKVCRFESVNRATTN